MAATAAPVIMSVEPQQLPEGYMQMLVPQMVPMCFVAAPEFCDGMWVPPLGGYEAMGPQGAFRGPNMHCFNGGKANSGAALAAPNIFYGGGSVWLEQQPAGPEEPVAVELSNLPKMLCNKNCLEASIEQAGLEVDVLELEVQLNKRGNAVILLSSERAAQRCIRHFHGLRWAKSSEPVCARYPAQAENVLTSQQQQAEAAAAVVDAKTSKASESVKASATSPKASPKMKPCASPVSTYCPSPSSTFCRSPASSFCKSPSINPSKPRWADLDSDNEDDESKSTLAGNSDEARETSDSGDSSNTEN